MSAKQPLDRSRDEILLQLTSDLLSKLSSDIKTAISAAAIPRFFNAQTLAVMLLLNSHESRQLHEQLVSMPFVQQYDDINYTIFDSVRMIILQTWNENRGDYRAINQRLAKYYSEPCKSDPLRLRKEKTEAIYHQIAADEELGFLWFEKELMQALALGQIDYCTHLLRAVEERSTDLKTASRLWLIFYRGLVFEKLQHWEKAQEDYRFLEIQEGWPSEIRAFFVSKIAEMTVRTRSIDPQQSDHPGVRPYEKANPEDSADIAKITEKLGSAQQQLKRYKLVVRLILTAIFSMMFLAVIFVLPASLQWEWLLNHPSRLGLQLCAALVISGASWAILDQDENRRWFALGSIVVAALIAVTQII